MPKTYVLDTSVLLSDPRAFARFEEHEVVVPLVVLTELEAQAEPPRAGLGGPPGAARRSRSCGPSTARSSEPLPVNDGGGTLRVELNHQELAGLPVALRVGRPTTTASSPSPATWPTRARTSPSSPRTCRCASRRASSASPPTSTATSWPPTRAGPASSSSTVEPGLIDELFEERVVDLDGGTRPAVPHRRSRCTPARSRPWPGCTPTSGCTSCGPTPRCSTSAAARPSSASPSTC